MKKLLICLLFILFCVTEVFALNVVRLGPTYFPESDRGRPISSGKIYVGIPDLDPTVVLNQKTLSVQQEDGSVVTVTQPILTNAGGIPIYLGSPVTLLVDGDYSLKILDSYDVQIYYVPSIIQLETSNLSDYNCNFATAVAEIGSTVTHLTVACDPDTLTANVTIPSTLTLEWKAGYTLSGAYTFTINGPLVAGDYQIFGSNLIVKGLDFANPLWWGAPGDGVIQKAIDSEASEVEIQNIGVVYLADGLTIPSTLKVLRGTGYPVITPSVGAHAIIEDGGSDFLITGINFTGNAGGSELTANQLIQITSFNYLRIKDNIFTNGWHRPTYLINCDEFEVSGNNYINCSNGPYFTGCRRGFISGNRVNGSQQADSVFKIGIALQTIDVTHGQNEDITISDNIINNLQNSQAILAHGGKGINIHGNQTTGCMQGINFNRQTVGDDILDVSIMNNRLDGVGSGAIYTPSADVGIVVSGTGETTGNIVISGNTIRRFNLKELNDNLGGVSIIAADNVVISSNTIQSCGYNGIVFSGADSSRVQVMNNIIDSISGSTAHGGVKVDSPTIVSGLFKNNWITNCDKAYRLETASLPDLIVESDNEFDNTTISTGIAAAIFNGSWVSTDLDSTPTVNHNIRYLVITNSVATDLTTLDNGILGQIVFLRFGDGNTTVKDVSTGGSFVLSGSADYTPGTKDTLIIAFSGTEWIQGGGENN